jgi:hypothetical protein
MSQHSSSWRITVTDERSVDLRQHVIGRRSREGLSKGPCRSVTDTRCGRSYPPGFRRECRRKGLNPPKRTIRTGGDCWEAKNPRSFAARLAWILADQSATATAEQHGSVRRWQKRDRPYRQVQQAALDDPAASDEARPSPCGSCLLQRCVRHEMAVLTGCHGTARSAPKWPHLLGEEYIVKGHGV